MGCDIHAAIEYRELVDGPWTPVMVANRHAGEAWGDDGPEPDFTCHLSIDRNYDLFAVLANVRNGSHGDAFPFISDRRGLPADISELARNQGCDGEHSGTWVSLTELLEYNWARLIRHEGWVNASEFEIWDNASRKKYDPAPRSYSGGVCGGNVRHVLNDEMRTFVNLKVDGKRGKEYTDALDELKTSHMYTLVEWEQPIADTTSTLWRQILPHALRCGLQFGNENVRLVMNFDS